MIRVQFRKNEPHCHLRLNDDENDDDDVGVIRYLSVRSRARFLFYRSTCCFKSFKNLISGSDVQSFSKKSPLSLSLSAFDYDSRLVNASNHCERNVGAPQFTGFVCTYHPAVPGLNPNHTIYVLPTLLVKFWDVWNSFGKKLRHAIDASGRKILMYAEVRIAQEKVK